MRPSLGALVVNQHTASVTNGELRTDREHSDNAVDGHTNHPLSLVRASSPDDLHTNVDSRLLPEAHDLAARTPVPTHQCLIRSRRDEVLGRQCNGTNTIEMSSELLEGREGERREEVYSAIVGISMRRHY